MEEKKIDRKRLREIETRKQRRKKEEKKKKKEKSSLTERESVIHYFSAQWFFKAGDTGLSTFKRSGAGEREAYKIGKSAFKGGATSLKVYNEEEKDKIGCGKEGR
ncbi:hypothetical protein Tco_0921772 [Tanacetum coccineum]